MWPKMDAFNHYTLFCFHFSQDRFDWLICEFEMTTPAKCHELTSRFLWLWELPHGSFREKDEREMKRQVKEKGKKDLWLNFVAVYTQVNPAAWGRRVFLYGWPKKVTGTHPAQRLYVGLMLNNLIIWVLSAMMVQQLILGINHIGCPDHKM